MNSLPSQILERSSHRRRIIIIFSQKNIHLLHAACPAEVHTIFTRVAEQSITWLLLSMMKVDKN